MLNALIETLDGLDKRNCLMLSIDGPNTDWSVLDKVSSHCQQMELPSFFDAGCCLHTVHGAFQTGDVATNWLLNKVLHSMWKLFKDSPAKRDTYIIVTCSEDFSLSFCKTRWVEDEKVAAKTVEIWPNIVHVIKHYEGLTPSKHPKNNKSYDILVKHATKLQFFGDVAYILSEFLGGFQNNSPMMPLLCGFLEIMIRRVMKMFIKEDVLNETVTVFRLIKIKFSETSNQLVIGDVKLTTATEALLKSCSVDKAAKENFRRDFVTFLLRMVQKLQEKSPLKYQIVRCLS